MQTWLIGVGIFGAFVLFAWSLCVVARRADDESDRMQTDLEDRR